jgi:hypothetical protein
MHTAILIALAFGASCSSDHDPLSEDATEEMVELPAAGGKADGLGHSEVTPGIRWLSERDESELARLFGGGIATEIPLGNARQQPLVRRYFSVLSSIVQTLFQGTTWQEKRAEDGSIARDDEGNPIVEVFSSYLTWLNDPYLAPYAGAASWGPMSELETISGAIPPSGWIYPHWVSPYSEAVYIDSKPSAYVDYQGESTPILGRSIDEFREIAPELCPGLYLTRTFYLRGWSRSRWSLLFYIAADFGPADRVCDLESLLR